MYINTGECVAHDWTSQITVKKKQKTVFIFIHLYSQLGKTVSCFMEKIFAGFPAAALVRLLCLEQIWRDRFTCC